MSPPATMMRPHNNMTIVHGCPSTNHLASVLPIHADCRPFEGSQLFKLHTYMYKSNAYTSISIEYRTIFPHTVQHLDDVCCDCASWFANPMWGTNPNFHITPSPMRNPPQSPSHCNLYCDNSLLQFTETGQGKVFYRLPCRPKKLCKPSL